MEKNKPKTYIVKPEDIKNINKKIEKQKKEANKKVENLPNYLPNIIKEVNRRLILDGVSS